MRIGEIRFNPADKDIHQINDIWLEGNTLYVSIFSPYDKWYPVKKNGGIVAIDLTDFHPNERFDIDPANHVVVSDLYMPQTVMVYKDQLAYCDSMSFCAVAGNQTKIQVACFTRGKSG